jgi:hypothetical protein
MRVSFSVLSHNHAGHDPGVESVFPPLPRHVTPKTETAQCGSEQKGDALRRTMHVDPKPAAELLNLVAAGRRELKELL